MAIPAFTWGAAGQKLSPSQTKKYSEIAAALAANNAAPQTLGAGLARVGDAILHNSYEAKAADGEAEGAASRKAVLDALMSNPDPSMTDIAGALGNEWVSSDPGSSAVVQALMAQENAQTQRGYELEDRNADWAHDSSVLEDQRAYDAPVREMQLESGQQGIDQGAAMAPLDLQYKQAQIDALGAKPAVTPTPDIQEYNLAVQQGFKGTIQDWLAAKPQAAGVNVYTGDGAGSNGQDPTLNKYLSQKEGEAWSGYKDAGTISASNAQDFGVLDELLTVAPQGPIVGRLADTFKGFSSAGDAVNSIVKRIAPTLRAVGSGATSDIEYQGMLDSLPTLSGTPEGNQMILSIMKAKAQVNMQRAEIVTKYQNGDLTVSQARSAMNELNQASIMSPEMRKALLGVGASDQVAPPVPQPGAIVEGYRFKGGNPADPASWEQVM
jgi:hypothetical protein